MRKAALWSAVLAGLGLLPLAPAHALDMKTFVRSDGSGSACTRAAPCASIDAAVAATLDGGEINCLDSGPIQGGGINKPVTVDCSGNPATIVPLVPGGTAITVNAVASGVRLRGLTLNGTGSSIGIDLVAGVRLAVENCLIMNFNMTWATGIRLDPGGAAVVAISDTIIDNNGFGVLVMPAGTVDVALNRVRFGFNVDAMILLPTGTGAARAVMRDSVVNSSRSNAILVGAAQLTLERSSILNNKGSGISTSTGAIVRIGDSTIAGNDFGVSQSGGAVQSFKENHISGNGVDGTPFVAFPGPGGTPLQ